MGEYNYNQVGDALKRLGNYRVRRAQVVANTGAPDGISGAALLSLGLRETGLRNINGGAVWTVDEEHPDGYWKATKKDKGVFQIASIYHLTALSKMLAVAEGTWAPVIAVGVTQEDRCPRYEESLQFTLNHMHEAQAYADDSGVPKEDLARFAIAAHNAGVGGALAGYEEGDIDKYTTLGDYSAWCLRHKTLIQRWLRNHLGWKA